MSAVKRVQKLFRQAEKRATAKINVEDTRKTEKQMLAQLANAAEQQEEVYVKATGRAIEKVLNVGKWFEEKGSEYTVRVSTGSVLVVDDVVQDEMRKENPTQKMYKKETTTTEPEQGTVKSDGKKRKREEPKLADDYELPETRTRWVKMVEVAISLK